MKKPVLIAIVLVALMIVALPPVLGGLAESRMRERVAAIDATSAWSAEIVEFDRGWFRSRATLLLGVSTEWLAQLDAPEELTITAAVASPATILVDLAHGPIAVLDGLHIGVSRMVARLDPAQSAVTTLERRLGVPYLFEFRGNTGFDGVLRFDAELPPFDASGADQHAVFSGVVLEGSLVGARIEARGTLDAVTLESSAGTLHASDVRLMADNELLSDWILLGRTEASIGRMSSTPGFAAAGRPSFEVANVRVVTSASLDDIAERRLRFAVDYSLDSVTAADMELSDIAMRLEMSNIDAGALQAYLDLVQREGAAIEADPGRFTAVLTPIVERGLRAGPVLTVDPLRFQLNGERLTAALRLSADPAKLPPAGALDLAVPAPWLEAATLEAQLDVAKPLAERIAGMMLAMQLAGDDGIPPDQRLYMAEAQAGLILLTLVGQGLLIDGGESYRAEITFADGGLSLNGSPLPFGLR